MKESFTSNHPSPLLRAGTQLYRYLQLLSCWVAGHTTRAQTEKRIYTVGNSVTGGVNFVGFKALAESKEYVHTLARHMIPGAPLSWLCNNHNGGFIIEPYEAPNNAFHNHRWFGEWSLPAYGHAGQPPDRQEEPRAITS
jgi:hypothetical protein